MKEQSVTCGHSPPKDAPLPLKLTLGNGRRRLTVTLCSRCAERLGASGGDRRVLELAAMTLVQNRMTERLSTVVLDLGEIAKLLDSR